MRILPSSSDLLHYGFKYLNRFNGTMNMVGLTAGLCAVVLGVFFAILASAYPLLAFVMLPCAGVLLVCGVVSVATGICGMINAYLNDALVKHYERKEAEREKEQSSYLSMLPFFGSGNPSPTPSVEKPAPVKVATPPLPERPEAIPNQDDETASRGLLSYLPRMPGMPSIGFSYW